MSRLDSFIRRLEAQRACLNRAADLIRGLDGPVFELGLGNGRTFDHLREILPDREIYVFDRQVAAHPDCIPQAERLILGDLRETLIAVRRRFAGRVALAHMDVATGHVASSLSLGQALAPLLVPLMRHAGLIVCEQELGVPCWRDLRLPAGGASGRYRIYQHHAGVPGPAHPCATNSSA